MRRRARCEVPEARSNECLKDLGSAGLNVPYSAMRGGFRELQIPCGGCGEWVCLKNFVRARLRGLEILGAGGGECLGDLSSWKFDVSYSWMSGGAWELQSPPRSRRGWVRLPVYVL